MPERTLAEALAHAEDVKLRGNDHCVVCEFPKNDGERKHAEKYGAQLKADAFCVVLADEIKRLREELDIYQKMFITRTFEGVNKYNG